MLCTYIFQKIMYILYRKIINIFAICSSLLKKRTLESTQQKDDDPLKQKKKKTKRVNDGHGKDSKKLKKHKKHFVAQR